MTIYDDKIRDIEEEIRKTQYNKATQHHVGLLKAKIAILKRRAEASSKKGPGAGFSVKKSGDSTACLLGFPSVGKSTLLNRLTNAESKIAAYAFTTLTCIPGILDYKSAKIQILDIPGIIKGAASGSGKGREILAVVRSSNLVIIVADIFDLKQIDTIKRELYDANIRLDVEKPQVMIKQTERGGLQIATTKKLTHTTEDTIRAILKEYKISNGYVTIREDLTPERLIDSLEENRAYMPSLVVLNKADLASDEDAQKAARLTGGIPVSAGGNRNIEALKEAIYRKLRLISVYLKEYGKKADNEPLIMRSGCTVRDVCRRLHRDFEQKFRYAKVWGKSAKYPGERFKIDHAMQDGDILEIKLR
ncbi:GTP-binding protein [Candidatus Woesearchaeota archaeon]|nr:GTP-binding protein [Candidatus Woesearchaeota archaeon]